VQGKLVEEASLAVRFVPLVRPPAFKAAPRRGPAGGSRDELGSRDAETVRLHFFRSLVSCLSPAKSAHLVIQIISSIFPSLMIRANIGKLYVTSYSISHLTVF